MKIIIVPSFLSLVQIGLWCGQIQFFLFLHSAEQDHRVWTIFHQAVHVNLNVKTVITYLCPLYDDIRRNVCAILRIDGEIDLNVILYGNTDLSIDQNKDMFSKI